MEFWNGDNIINAFNRFSRKGYGRIVVEKETDIEKIKIIIKNIDEYEYSYLPEDLICIHSEKIELRYTHKFSDLDLNELIIKCWDSGIKCYVLH